MLWACLRFPQLALEVAGVDADECARRPFAVLDGPLHGRRIVLANASACHAGVRQGQPLSAAQALCPHLSIASRDPAAERQALESIASFAYRFSADVSIAGPDAVLLEVGASLGLFGGIAGLQRRLRHELAAFGFVSTLAIAPTAAGACVLAAHAAETVIPSPQAFVDALGLVPLTKSGLDANTIAALHGMGFRLLRDLFRLPRAELARRIGPDALGALDRMRGLAAESLLRYRPPERFEHRLELHFGVESNAALAFALQRLIRGLATFLIARDGGVQRFALILGHECGASTRFEVGLSAPRRDAASLFELARARLERIALPAPVHALTLRADDLPPLCPLHRDLFDASRNETLDWPSLAERLRARLGDAALRGLRCAADHRPGHAWRFAAIDEETARNRDRDDSASSNLSCGEASGLPCREFTPIRSGIREPTRPFWLLERLVRLDGAPIRVIAGPERIESGWWDGRDKCRDYYVIETHLGQRGWAFVPAGTTKGWMLHGWFA